MVPRAALAVALALLLVLPGCAGVLPGDDEASPTAVEPRLLGTVSTGGQCVDSPRVGTSVESGTTDGGRTVTVEANVTVPGAHYVVDEISLSRLDERTFRLDVTTTADPEKPERACPDGGVVHYEATLQLPDADGSELEVRHDGTTVARLGSGPS